MEKNIEYKMNGVDVYGYVKESNLLMESKELLQIELRDLWRNGVTIKYGNTTLNLKQEFQKKLIEAVNACLAKKDPPEAPVELLESLNSALQHDSGETIQNAIEQAYLKIIEDALIEDALKVTLSDSTKQDLLFLLYRGNQSAMTQNGIVDNILSKYTFSTVNGTGHYMTHTPDHDDMVSDKTEPLWKIKINPINGDVQTMQTHIVNIIDTSTNAIVGNERITIITDVKHQPLPDQLVGAKEEAAKVWPNRLGQVCVNRTISANSSEVLKEILTLAALGADEVRKATWNNNIDVASQNPILQDALGSNTKAIECIENYGNDLVTELAKNITDDYAGAPGRVAKNKFNFYKEKIHDIKKVYNYLVVDMNNQNLAAKLKLKYETDVAISIKKIKNASIRKGIAEFFMGHWKFTETKKLTEVIKDIKTGVDSVVPSPPR